MERIIVNGHDGLNQKLEQLEHEAKGSRLFIYFVGSKLPETGKSWCPDCVKAEPVLQQALQQLEEKPDMKVVVLTCEVGFRDEWKSAENPIKNDPKLGVECIPTLIEYSLENCHSIKGRKLDKEEDFQESARIISFIKKTN